MVRSSIPTVFGIVGLLLALPPPHLLLMFWSLTLFCFTGTVAVMTLVTFSSAILAEQLPTSMSISL